MEPEQLFKYGAIAFGLMMAAVLVLGFIEAISELITAAKMRPGTPQEKDDDD